MKKSTTYAIVAVIVIIIIIAAVVLLVPGILPAPSPSPTPTPTPTVTGADVANATTLTFSANVTSQGQTTEYKWSGKDIHSSNLTIRVDFSTYSYILSASDEKAWASTDSGVTWTASDFASLWGTVAAPGFGNQWTDFADNLTHWDGSATYSYTDAAGEAILLFNINVNPTIPASTFAVS